jgi:4-amino-4-deoxy-L-arabinose transferase-like glycosyltransferase
MTHRAAGIGHKIPGLVSVGAAEQEFPRGAGAARSAVAVSPATAAVAALTLLAAAVRFSTLGRQGYWYDEGNTVLIMRSTLGGMLGLLAHNESTPPLYYILAWFWGRVFGWSEVGLRSLSALIGVATVPAVYLAGRRLVSTRAGVIAAALTACSPILIWYSQEARAYALLVLMSALSLLAFAYARERPNRPAMIAWALVAALALATHYYTLLVVVPQAMWLLAAHRHRWSVWAAVAFVAACGLALLPLASTQQATGRTTWITGVALARRLGQVYPQFAVWFAAPAYAALAALSLGLCVLGLVLLVVRSDPRERRGGLVAAALATGGLVLMLLIVAAGTDNLITRNALAIWIPTAIAVSAGFAARRARRLGALAAAAVCVIGLVAAIDVAATTDLQRPDWRPVARMIGEQRPSAALRGKAVLLQQFKGLVPLGLYVDGLRTMRRRGAAVSELYIVGFATPPGDGFCWWGSACNLRPSRMQRSYPVPGFHEVWRRRVYRFTVVRLVADHPVHISPAEVGRALTTTALKGDALLLQRS